MVDDGLLVSYAHRSFQEYFVARFISDAKPTIQEKLISKYSINLVADNMLSLLYEMRPELVERVLIIPAIDEIERVIGVKKSVGITHYTRYLKGVLSTATIRGGGDVTLYAGKRARFLDILNFTFQHCGDLAGGIRPKWAPIVVSNKIAHGKVIEIDVSKLTYKDRFIRDFANSSHVFSKAALERLLSIKKELIQRHLNADHSLDEILKS